MTAEEPRLRPEQIRALRAALGWTIERMATELGIPRATLRGYLADPGRARHRRVGPEADHRLRRLATQHGLDPERLPPPDQLDGGPPRPGRGVSPEVARRLNDRARYQYLKVRYGDLGRLVLAIDEEEARLRRRVVEELATPATKAVLDRLLDCLRAQQDEVSRSICRVYDRIERQKRRMGRRRW